MNGLRSSSACGGRSVRPASASRESSPSHIALAPATSAAVTISAAIVAVCVRDIAALHQIPIEPIASPAATRTM